MGGGGGSWKAERGLSMARWDGWAALEKPWGGQRENLKTDRKVTHPPKYLRLGI